MTILLRVFPASLPSLPALILKSTNFDFYGTLQHPAGTLSALDQTPLCYGCIKGWEVEQFELEMDLI